MTAKQIAYKKWRDRHKEQEQLRWKEWYALNSETQRSRARKTYDALRAPERRNRRLKKVYGIDLTEYNIKLANQKNKCAICGRLQTDLKRDFAVDHCHRTKQVRGLLCGRCNLGLAFLENNGWHKKATGYLEVYSNHA